MFLRNPKEAFKSKIDQWRLLMVRFHRQFCTLHSFAPCSEHLRQYKASQNLSVGRKLFGVGRKQVDKINPRTLEGWETLVSLFFSFGDLRDCDLTALPSAHV